MADHTAASFLWPFLFFLFVSLFWWWWLYLFIYEAMCRCRPFVSLYDSFGMCPSFFTSFLMWNQRFWSSVIWLMVGFMENISYTGYGAFDMKHMADLNDITKNSLGRHRNYYLPYLKHWLTHESFPVYSQVTALVSVTLD